MKMHIFFFAVSASEYEKIDILINCAGLTFHPFEKTTDNFETHLQVNYLGHFLLSQLLLPLLNKSFQGRIINVSAHAYASAKMDTDDTLNLGTWAPTYHPRDAFAHSKLCILLATRKLAKELKGWTKCFYFFFIQSFEHSVTIFRHNSHNKFLHTRTGPRNGAFTAITAHEGTLCQSHHISLDVAVDEVSKSRGTNNHLPGHGS
jgi:hypothetical protein